MNKKAILERYLIEIRGKVFVQYAGLVELAHLMGLQSIETELIKLNPETGLAIFKATAKANTHKNGIVTFTGYGDASPKNVSNLVKQHLIRVAETRAKARALRDMVGCPYTAAEELGG